MDQHIKKHIQRLAEKFEHQLYFEKQVMVLRNEINEIKIWEENKYEMNIHFNENEKSIKKELLKKEHIYDLLIEVLSRKKLGDPILRQKGNLLTLKELIDVEGAFMDHEIKQIIKDRQTKDISYRNLGGNQYLVEYFKGVLILTDDLRWAKSNVISI